SECPANVDMATYKAEFLSHYYASNSRPLRAYLFGFVDRFARWASLAPRLVNFVAGTSGTRALLAQVCGLAAQRQIPRLATENFRKWARRTRPELLGSHGAAGARRA